MDLSQQSRIIGQKIKARTDIVDLSNNFFYDRCPALLPPKHFASESDTIYTCKYFWVLQLLKTMGSPGNFLFLIPWSFWEFEEQCPLCRKPRPNLHKSQDLGTQGFKFLTKQISQKHHLPRIKVPWGVGHGNKVLLVMRSPELVYILVHTG
jgi:hypothetical protein